MMTGDDGKGTKVQVASSTTNKNPARGVWWRTVFMGLVCLINSVFLQILHRVRLGWGGLEGRVP